MGAVPRVVVFKDSVSEIARLRTLFYGSKESQSRALALCRAYEVRGVLPASIHLTALLISAVHMDVPMNDMFAIRQTYAMALIRFVNEILDAAQLGRNAIPLHALAREMDLPNSFVELRHAATHEDLPSAPLLREMAHRAVHWLWIKYWALNDAPQEPSTLINNNSDVGDEAPQDRIKETLREWRRSRRPDPENPELTYKEIQLVETLKRDLLIDQTAFFEVLFHRNILVPAGSGEVSKKGSPSVILWGPLFSKLGEDYLVSLAEKIATALNKQDWPEIGPSERQFPVYMTWLEYLIPLVNKPIAALSALPRPWNAILLNLYGLHHNHQPSIQLARDMAVVTGTEIPTIELKKIPGSVNNHNEDDSESPWPRVSEWVPRPIGV